LQTKLWPDAALLMRSVRPVSETSTRLMNMNTSTTNLRISYCFASVGKKAKKGKKQEEINAVPKQQDWRKNESQKDKEKAAGL
jgi:hypothetical protein